MSQKVIGVKNKKSFKKPYFKPGQANGKRKNLERDD